MCLVGKQITIYNLQFLQQKESHMIKAFLAPFSLFLL